MTSKHVTTLRMRDRIEAALGNTECIAVERGGWGRKGQSEVVREREGETETKR